MPAKKQHKGKCLNCSNKVKWRGVCLACYMLAKRRIEAGEATDENLVKAGFWMSPQKGPRSARAAEMRRKLAACSK